MKNHDPIGNSVVSEQIKKAGVTPVRDGVLASGDTDARKKKLVKNEDDEQTAENDATLFARLEQLEDDFVDAPTSSGVLVAASEPVPLSGDAEEEVWVNIKEKVGGWFTDLGKFFERTSEQAATSLGKLFESTGDQTESTGDKSENAVANTDSRIGTLFEGFGENASTTLLAGGALVAIAAGSSSSSTSVDSPKG